MVLKDQNLDNRLNTLSSDPNENAAVQKEYGNGRCSVKCIDGVERISDYS